LFAPFERGQLLLDDLLARIAVPAVLFALLLLLDEVDNRLRASEGIGRGADNGVRDRVRDFLAGFAGVNGERGKAGFGRGRHAKVAPKAARSTSPHGSRTI